MGRSPCCSKEGLNRGAWTAAEDKLLTDYITTHGEGGWRNLPKRAGLNRCGKSCRLRWLNYLRPDIKRGNISEDEEELIIRLHNLLGNRWSLIAGRLPGRTDNEIKNFWNTTLCKKVKDNNNNHNNKPDVHNYKYSCKSLTTLEKQKPRKSCVAEPRVIRTKAFRCATKVCIKEQGKPSRSEAPAANVEEDMPTLDFLLDFDIEELCLSDLLKAEFSLQPNDTIQPGEKMLQGSTAHGGCGHSTTHSDSTSCSDFLSFTPFLDCQQVLVDDEFLLHQDQLMITN